MTTSQNRQPKGITTGGQFAPDAHAESTLLLDPATRDITLSPGQSESFQDLADGDVIETLNVSRSDDGSGFWISPAKTVNAKRSPVTRARTTCIRRRGSVGGGHQGATRDTSLNVRDVGSNPLVYAGHIDIHPSG